MTHDRGTQTPGFRYSRSADGTSIAWMRLGSGPPLVIVPPVPLSNVSGDWTVPLLRDVFERLSTEFELILYDGRGTGASQRSWSGGPRATAGAVPEEAFSIEALTADLEAVLDDAGVGSATLLAIYLACPPAITYAAQRPDRVSHLVLFGAADRGQRSFERPGTSALLGLIDDDWDLFTRTAALDWMGWGVGEAGQLVSESFRTATTPEVAKAGLAVYGATDLRPLLGRIGAPTLVLHRRDGRQVPIEQSADLAAAIPGGRLHVLDGASATLFFDDPVGTVDVIADFALTDRSTSSRRTGPGDSGSGASGRTPDPDASEALTAREREVLSLIAAGETNAEIAHRLGLSVHTVERHAANIYRKIDARGRADATAWALRHGLG